MKKKNFAYVGLIVTAILFLVGIVLIFASLSLGESAGAAALQRRGGSMDTTTYERIINATILNYRVVGIILASIGGIGVLLSGNAVHKDI